MWYLHGTCVLPIYVVPTRDRLAIYLILCEGIYMAPTFYLRATYMVPTGYL